MIDRRRILIPIFLTILIILAGISARPLQQVTGEGDWYFPETKQTVSGEFLDFYQSTDDYMLNFGYPISGVEDHPVYPGVKVQYFSRARFELHPNEPAGKKINLAMLGVWLYESNRGKPADLAYTPGACRMIGTAEVAVCYDFLKFYDAHDGPALFGEPVSTLEEMPNGRLVQYFERARMEWWPERPIGMRVALTDVGYMDYQRNHVISISEAPNNVGPLHGYQIKAHAFSAKPLVSPNGEQTVYVIVSDQTSQPVKGALVILVVRLPDGRNLNHRLDETEANGLTKAEFSVGDLTPNQVVQVDVKVTTPDGASTTTSTYFRIWW